MSARSSSRPTAPARRRCPTAGWRPAARSSTPAAPRFRAARGWAPATACCSTRRAGAASSASPRCSTSRAPTSRARPTRRAGRGRCRVELLVVVPLLSNAPPVEAIGVSPRSMSQQSHIRLRAAPSRAGARGAGGRRALSDGAGTVLQCARSDHCGAGRGAASVDDLPEGVLRLILASVKLDRSTPRTSMDSPVTLVPRIVHSDTPRSSACPRRSSP